MVFHLDLIVCTVLFLNLRCNISQAELVVELKGTSEHGPCRVWTQILDRHDGSFIVRYKMFQVGFHHNKLF